MSPIRAEVDFSLLGEEGKRAHSVFRGSSVFLPEIRVLKLVAGRSIRTIFSRLDPLRTAPASIWMNRFHV